MFLNKLVMSTNFVNNSRHRRRQVPQVLRQEWMGVQDEQFGKRKMSENKKFENLKKMIDENVL